MAEQQTPEMLRLSLQDLVMRVKICKLGDIEATLAQALDPPTSRNIRRAIDALVEVDALTPSEELTPLGRQIAKLPLDAHLGKLVLLASTFGCVDVAITIAAVVSSKSPFLTPFGAKQRADIAQPTREPDRWPPARAAVERRAGAPPRLPCVRRIPVRLCGGSDS